MSIIEYKFKAVGQHEVIAAFRAINQERDRFIMKWIPAVSLVIGTLWFAGVAHVSMRLAAIGAYVAVVFAGILLVHRGISELLARRRRAVIGVNSDGTRPTKAIVYDKAFVYINGKLLGEAESANVDIERKVGIDAADTRTLRARVVSLVPTSGFEFDGFRFANCGDPVELMLRFGGSGRTLKSNGCIGYASLVTSAKEPTRLEFEFNGEPAAFVAPEHPLMDAAKILLDAANSMTAAKQAQ